MSDLFLKKIMNIFIESDSYLNDFIEIYCYESKFYELKNN